jgi:hypothetical protein
MPSIDVRTLAVATTPCVSEGERRSNVRHRHESHH